MANVAYIQAYQDAPTNPEAREAWQSRHELACDVVRAVGCPHDWGATTENDIIVDEVTRELTELRDRAKSAEEDERRATEELEQVKNENERLTGDTEDSPLLGRLFGDMRRRAIDAETKVSTLAADLAVTGRELAKYRERAQCLAKAQEEYVHRSAIEASQDTIMHLRDELARVRAEIPQKRLTRAQLTALQRLIRHAPGSQAMASTTVHVLRERGFIDRTHHVYTVTMLGAEYARQHA